MKKKTARLSLPPEATERTELGKTKQTKNKNIHWHEQKRQSHTCDIFMKCLLYDHIIHTSMCAQNHRLG
jgi:hypothetical protein